MQYIYIYFSNISVFFIAFLLQLFLLFHSLQVATSQFNVWMMKADNWPVEKGLLYCWGSAKVGVLYFIL